MSFGQLSFVKEEPGKLILLTFLIPQDKYGRKDDSFDLCWTGNGGGKSPSCQRYSNKSESIKQRLREGVENTKNSYGKR